MTEQFAGAAPHKPATVPASRTQLTPKLRKQFNEDLAKARECMSVILRYRSAISECGQALKRMYETESWQETYSTWDALCAELHDRTVRLNDTASVQLMAFAEGIANLPPAPAFDSPFSALRAALHASPPVLELNEGEAGRKNSPSKLQEAVNFLWNMLYGRGPVLKQDIDDAAKKAGIATKTLRDAKEYLKEHRGDQLTFKVSRVEFGGKVSWCLLQKSAES
jgi:hypothetical protein